MTPLSALRLTSVADPSLAGFDAIIDVRAPAEFAEDHLPGAVNLPVLNDTERAQVGTVYKQISPFDARKMGAALVAANSARHIAGALADKPGGWRPLVYCWRGGQRSGAFATILSQIGWRVTRIEGGHRDWRRLVVDRVQKLGIPAPVVVLDGDTGSAKTAILSRLAARGVQVIDLEALANHRGSLFGAMPGGQPGQKLFEGRLAHAIEALDPARPVVIEAESSRIGALSVPRAVWAAICDAPRIRVDAPVSERAAFTARSYAEAAARAPEMVERLRPLHPADRIASWLALVEGGDWSTLAHALLRDHYDPRYQKHRARFAGRERAVVPAALLTETALDGVAADVHAALARLCGQ